MNLILTNYSYSYSYSNCIYLLSIINIKFWNKNLRFSSLTGSFSTFLYLSLFHSSNIKITPKISPIKNLLKALQLYFTEKNLWVKAFLQFIRLFGSISRHFFNKSISYYYPLNSYSIVFKLFTSRQFYKCLSA